MITQLFTVYDSKAEAYAQPFHQQSKGAAIRAFTDTVADPTHAFHRHPEDYVLFHLGSYDDQNAAFDLFASPVPLIRANEVKEISE